MTYDLDCQLKSALSGAPSYSFPSFPHCSLWTEVTLHSPHLRSGVIHPGVYLHDPASGSSFLEVTPTAQAPREKIDKQDLTKSKSFVRQRPPSRKQTHPTEQEEFFANNISDKGFIFRIHEEFLKIRNSGFSIHCWWKCKIVQPLC